MREPVDGAPRGRLLDAQTSLRFLHAGASDLVRARVATNGAVTFWAQFTHELLHGTCAATLRRGTSPSGRLAR